MMTPIPMDYVRRIVFKLADLTNNKQSYECTHQKEISIIPYICLPEPLFMMFDELISSKRIRFRYYMSAVIAGFFLTSYTTIPPLIAILVSMLIAPKQKNILKIAIYRDT